MDTGKTSFKDFQGLFMIDSICRACLKIFDTPGWNLTNLYRSLKNYMIALGEIRDDLGEDPGDIF